MSTQIILVTVTIDGAILAVAGGQIVEDAWAKRAVLFLGAIVNVFIIFMLKMIEWHQRATFEKILSFAPEYMPDLGPEKVPATYRFSSITLFCMVIFMFAVMFGLAALNLPESGVAQTEGSASTEEKAETLAGVEK
ncbi:MAG: hypothetical protein QNI84_15085 [Henriciella sp.]|nr:hypothetical protein [Henriciella sp.]